MNMKMASILCLVIMLAGCVAGQQRGLVGDTYVSSSQPALALKARELPLMGSTMGASRLTSSGAMGGLIVDSWITVYGKGDGASPLAIVAHGELPDGWYWDGIMRHPFSINEGVETIGGVSFQACTYVTSEKRDAFLPLEDPEGARILAQDAPPLAGAHVRQPFRFRQRQDRAGIPRAPARGHHLHHGSAAGPRRLYRRF